MRNHLGTCWSGLLLVFGILVHPTAALAWNDHTLGAYPALEALPEVKNAPAVQPESLEQLLAAEEEGFARVLQEVEAWSRKNVPGYPARPDGLEFQAGGPAETRRTRFLEALRVNPNIKTPLYVQPLPGAETAGRTPLPWQEVTLMREILAQTKTPFLTLPEGQPTPALEVVATATDEPDYGLDIGLWEDNNTEYGKRFGFGPQPFGNPKLEYSSQAPFHIGLFHEAGIIYALASFTKRTFPEHRIRLFQALARHAFQTGHPYWGWRFTGWGLHYIEDLTQPYHASLLPGVSVGRMLLINALNMLGAKGPQTRAVQLVTNRHLAVENHQYELLLELYRTGRPPHPVMQALQDVRLDAAYPGFTPGYVREVLTKESHARAKKTDRTLEKSLPARLVSDPSYQFETCLLYTSPSPRD